MKQTLPLQFLIAIFFLSHRSYAQLKPKAEFYLPKTFSKTKLWHKAELKRGGANSDAVSVFGDNGTPPDTMKLADCLKAIKTIKDYNAFLNTKSWAVKYYNETFPYLIAMLEDTTTVGLTNTDNIIIPRRDLQFYGHAVVINEDIFTVAGRASYILNQLTGENFAVVQMETSIGALKNFQSQWVDWIRKLKS